MTPTRRRAWNRYDNAQINLLSAGSLVGQLVDAYEELEKARWLLTELRALEATGTAAPPDVARLLHHHDTM